MKKVLVQLDTARFPSPFDAIAAVDSDVDVLLPYAGVKPDDVAEIVQGAMFPRGPKGLVNTAIWIGGNKVKDGEALLDAVKDVFFDPFRLSVMHDSDGCNTTAAAGVIRVKGAVGLKGKRAMVVGAGPVGLRSAELLRREGADVVVSGLTKDSFDGNYRRASGLKIAEELELTVQEPEDAKALRESLDGVELLFAGGPAGIQVLSHDDWKGTESLQVVVDYSATEPVGVEGIDSGADLEEQDGKLVLGALAVGGPKMKLQKACVRRLFEESGLVLDVDGVYDVALGME